ncbi:MAG TPA: cyanophycinase [Thermoanaerobaculia bacterium]|nr:cyanophycinase [Thermoanaerobaculia bacterium]HUM30938.1 cyanophycinase [Thermoanaerobaculia bacterium]HXK69271.1 cyanophycinase [Thermoanaerobaculia bacterium]
MIVEGNVMPGAGRLILIGGAEDKFNERVILQRVVHACRAGRIAIIPTASEIPRELGGRYRRAFSDLGVTQVDILDIRHSKEADLPPHLEVIQQADAVFFTGGDQVKLVEILEGSNLLALIKTRHAEGMVVAGTSAGAAAASDTMIFDGDDEGHSKGTIRHRAGFSFLKGITVDSHFLVRCRISRLMQVIASGLTMRGIGLAEDTAIDLESNGTFTVLGSGAVVLLSGEWLEHSNYNEVKKGEAFSVDGIRLSLLAPGARFDLSRWEVIVPLHSGSNLSAEGEDCSSPGGRANE